MAGVKGIREYYDKTAGAWAERWYEDNSMLPVLRHFMMKLPARARVLDLCCGAGYESMRLVKLGAEVVGIDLSEVSIAIARKHNPDIAFYVGNMLDDYGYIGSVDGIACIAGLVHLQQEELRAAFEKMANVLSEGGKVLFVVRDGEGRLKDRSEVMIDGELYDRAFYAHSLSVLRRESKGIFKFEEEILPDSSSVWKNYLFSRI